MPVFVGDAQLAKQASDLLLHKHNIYVQSINYPTVPKGEERLRITPTPGHDQTQIDRLCHSLIDVWKVLELKKESNWIGEQSGDFGVVERLGLGGNISQCVDITA